jgi:hypothetical protein
MSKEDKKSTLILPTVPFIGIVKNEGKYEVTLCEINEKNYIAKRTIVAKVDSLVEARSIFMITLTREKILGDI